MATTDRAARERKQKMFVAVGGVVLLLLLAIQLPKLLGGSSGSSESAAQTTTSADTVGVAPVAGPSARAVSVALVDTDRPLPPAPGKLSSLRVFSKKDPFVQQVKTDTPETASPVAAKGSGGGQKPVKTGTTGFTVGPAAASVTVISVNGARQALVPGAAFPSANPVFVLVAEQAKTKTVTIGIAGGAYASGAKATKLKVGKPLVLVNTTTGARYKLVLVAVGDGSGADRTAAKSPEKPSASTP
jgi:hypothetical protein